MLFLFPLLFECKFCNNHQNNRRKIHYNKRHDKLSPSFQPIFTPSDNPKSDSTFQLSSLLRFHKILIINQSSDYQQEPDVCSRSNSLSKHHRYQEQR